MIKINKEKKVSLSDSVNRNKTPAIVEYARANLSAKVSYELSDDPTCVNQQDPSTGMTALHWAAINRHVEIASIILSESGCDPWLEDKLGRKALELAIQSGASRIVEMLHKEMFPENFEPEPTNQSPS